MRALLLVLLVAAGCNGAVPALVEWADAGLPTPDGGVTADAGTNPRVDGGVGRDAGVPPRQDAGMCVDPDVWTLQPAAVVDVELLSDAPRRMGVTERLAVTVVMERACSQLPRLDVTINQGNATDFVQISARAFEREQGCPIRNQTVVLFTEIPGDQQGNFMVSVQWNDGQFSYDRQPCMGAACNCSPGTPRGNANAGEMCASDCDCRPPFSCLGVPGAMGGGRFRCALPCSDGLDCLPQSTRCVMDRRFAPPMTCDLQDTGCGSSGDCPNGFECRGTGMGRRCVDQRPFPGQACACGGACGPQDSCEDPFMRGETTCERLCNRNVDCPQNVFICAGTLCRPLE